jgi:hypothetical protein
MSFSFDLLPQLSYIYQNFEKLVYPHKCRGYLSEAIFLTNGVFRGTDIKELNNLRASRLIE